MSGGRAKTPVVMQMEAQECGAASLTMVLAYFGKWLPLEQVRADCGVSRDGSNALNILKAARRYGLEGKGYRMEPERLVAGDAPFPCILHWNLDHFVVLCGFHRGFALINDPARGAVRVPMDEFDRAFTGICLTFEPTAAFEQGGKPKSVVAFARERLQGANTALLFAVATGLIIAVTGAISPAFGRVFLDYILPGGNGEWFRPFLIGLSALALIEVTVTAIQAVCLLRIQGKLAAVANAKFMWHVLRLPMTFFAQRLAGDIAQRQSSNERIAASLIEQLAPVALNACMLAVYLTVMVRYSPLLALVGVLSVLVNALVARLVAGKRLNILRVQMRDSGKLAASTYAGIDMIETVKASGAERGYFEKWSGYQASVNAQATRFMRVTQYLGSVPGLVQSLANVAILTLGAALTLRGDFTAGMLLAFQSFFLSFAAPVNSLIGMGQALQEMRGEMERVEDVMKYPAAVPDGDGLDEQRDYAKLTGSLVLRDVNFGYSPLGAPLIEHFDLTLEPGRSVALVGPSGCGKSTLAKLISGLYKPWSGEILFDGKPIDAIPRPVFTGSVSVVDQDVVLFADTIRANIKMWDDTIEDFEMILAARDAQIHEEIVRREGGYGCRLMENGKDLSGGQRQRIEIARVLAQDPTLLVMDEATSALDAKTECAVMDAVRARGLTTVVIAHRLSTVRDCDEIIVLDQGKVAERGTHKELYARGGLYARLVSND